MAGRQFKCFDLFLFLWSGRCFHHAAGAVAQQEFHGFREALSIESADKINGIAALLLILMEPQVAPDGHLLPMIQPHIFRAGLLHFLPALPQESRQIGPSGLLPLLLRKRHVTSHITSNLHCSLESFLQARERNTVYKFVRIEYQTFPICCKFFR